MQERVIRAVPAFVIAAALGAGLLRAQAPPNADAEVLRKAMTPIDRWNSPRPRVPSVAVPRSDQYLRPCD